MNYKSRKLLGKRIANSIWYILIAICLGGLVEAQGWLMTFYILIGSVVALVVIVLLSVMMAKISIYLCWFE